MRIVLLSKALVVGAYQRKCEHMAECAGVALTVLVPERWGAQRVERAHTNGYDLRVLPIRLSGNFHLHHYPTLPAQLRELQPDVFLIDEEPYNLATWMALRAALALPQRPRIAFFSWQNLLRSYPPPFRWMERDVLRRADAGIVGSAEAAQVWRAKGFAGPLAVVPQFGVDDDAFTPGPPRDASAPFTVGFAGRLVPEKGVDLLLRALIDAPGVQARVLGDGPQRPALAALAQSLGVADRVRFEDPLPSTRMPEFYRGLDALALPSRTLPNWKEQFGRVLIEAMACGVPVIGARSGEIPHVVDDAGLLFPEGDAAALAAHLRALAADPALRDDLAERGRTRVRAHFTMRAVARATVEALTATADDR